MTVVIFLGLLAAGLAGLVFVILYNGLVTLRNDCDRAWSNIDVLLKQRYEEIPRLVEVCKGYMAHEKDTLTLVTRARTAGLRAEGPAQTSHVEDLAVTGLRNLFAVAEGYPDLKANENFLLLQKRISGLESEIADRREFFNNTVNNFNTRIEQVPDVFVARMLGYGRKSLFRVPASQRKSQRIAA